MIPLGNWAWDALTEETPLTDGALTCERVPGALVRAADLMSDVTREPGDRRGPGGAGRARPRVAGDRPGLFSVRLPGTPQAGHRVCARGRAARGWASGPSSPGGRTRTRRPSTAGCWSRTSSCTGSPSPSDALGDIYLTGKVVAGQLITRPRSTGCSGSVADDRRRQLQLDLGTRLRRQHPPRMGLAALPGRVDRQPRGLHPPPTAIARGRVGRPVRTGQACCGHA